ncbi:MAG: hypothetical protein K1X89_06145 [Myxococcaceae bacterium]|nr:hypothetical protein [Myxococcaceae bacterium]
MPKPTSAVQRAIREYQAGDYDAALETLSTLGARAPLQALRVRAYCHAKLGQVPHAIEAYRAAIAAHGGDDDLRWELELELGLELMKAGRRAEAAKHVDRATSERPRLGLHPSLETTDWRGALPAPRLSPTQRRQLGLSDRGLRLVRQALDADDIEAFRDGYTPDLPEQFERSSEGHRPLLHAAVEARAARIVRFLVAEGVDVTARWERDGASLSAEDLARELGHEELVGALRLRVTRSH